MYLAKLTTETFREAMNSIDTVILPIGSIESHGFHCPLATDVIIPERIAADLDVAIGEKVLIAPTIPYGYSPDLAYFPGTVHVSGEVLAGYVSEVATSWLSWGVRNIILLNGHGGNIPALTLAADKLVAKGARVLTISWWVTFSSEILGICEAQGHAGEDETSLVLAIDSSQVDMSLAGCYEKRISGPFKVPNQVTYTFPNAMNGDARKASEAKGSDMLAIMKERVLELIANLWDDLLLK